MRRSIEPGSRGEDKIEANPPLAALTGATGFIGRHVAAALARSGWRVRLLARRAPAPPAWDGFAPEIVPGSLADAAALERLVEGATAVVHLAGLIKAPSRRAFFEANRDAAEALALATRRLAPQAHFVHVSSLAAREPGLSDYAASKRAGEEAVRATLDGQCTVLRPAAVYGPGDPETLRFFQIARQRVVPLPGPAAARAALVHVGDLARLVAAVAAAGPRHDTLAVADERPAGYGWREILQAAALAVGNPSPRFVQAPRALLRAIALAGDAGRLAGSATMLNSQKLRELSHLDWSVAPAEQARPPGWRAEFDLEAGFADAVAWYRRAGWLPR